MFAASVIIHYYIYVLHDYILYDFHMSLLLGVELAIVWLHVINKFMLLAEKAPQKLKTIKKLTIRSTFFLP